MPRAATPPGDVSVERSAIGEARWLGVVVLFATGGAYLAGLCPRSSVQRVGRHPARTYAGHKWCLWRRPQPQLSGVAHQLAGMGLGFSCGGWRAAHGASCPAASRPHTRGGGVNRFRRCGSFAHHPSPLRSWQAMRSGPGAYRTPQPLSPDQPTPQTRAPLARDRLGFCGAQAGQSR